MTVLETMLYWILIAPILAAAAQRAWMIWLKQEIARPLRNWLTSLRCSECNKVADVEAWVNSQPVCPTCHAEPKVAPSFRFPFIGYGASCAFCTSVWISAGMLGLWMVPYVWWIVPVLALSQAMNFVDRFNGLLESLLEKMK